jgi:hypothetical protein
MSYILFNSTYSSNTFKSIIIAVTKVLIALNTETAIILINSKKIIIIKIIIFRTGILSSLLFGIN